MVLHLTHSEMGVFLEAPWLMTEPLGGNVWQTGWEKRGSDGGTQLIKYRNSIATI